MRAISLWTASVLLVGASVFGQQSVTVKGVAYVGAELIKEYPQSVYIRHASGRSFVNKADLSAEDKQALGITSLVADAFQQALDKDFRDLQAGRSYAPPTPPPVKRPPSTPAPSSSLAGAARSMHSMKAVPTSSAQHAPTATTEPQMVPADFPEEWGGRPKGRSRRAEEKQKEWDDQRAFQIASQGDPEAMQAYIERRDAARAQLELETLRMHRNQSQVQIQQMEWAHQTPHTISAVPAAPRSVNTHDSAGNFHTGVVQPTGFYNGTVHSPRGDVRHISGNFSPSGSFQGTDNHGEFYHGH